jgi:hypothetical protein
LKQIELTAKLDRSNSELADQRRETTSVQTQLDMSRGKESQLSQDNMEKEFALKLLKVELANAKPAAEQLSTVTHALGTAHRRIHQLTEVPSGGPEGMLKVMVSFLQTHHKAHVTFEQ